MKIAVLSGKGGAGKTMVAANLAAAAKEATYIDCDVEEPNGRLFLPPDEIQEDEVHTFLPVFDKEKCTGCKTCVKLCRFHALIYIKEKPKVFSEVCHSCGLCEMACPQKAIGMAAKTVGRVESGTFDSVTVRTGILNPGEASGIPVIQAAMAKAGEGLTIIDCPPGSACSVMECVSHADACLLVAEATAFGFHNFTMVHELASILGKPCYVVINKEEAPFAPLETYCKEKNLPVVLRIPFRKDFATLGAEGKLLCRETQEGRVLFSQLLHRIGGALN